MRSDTPADVAIVGFGPVGAVAACLLGQAGLDVSVIEASTTIYDRPRAVALDHEIARVLQGLGLAEALLACAEPFTDSVYYGADGRVIKRLTMVQEPYPQGWTPSMVFRQPQLEEAIRAKAAGFPNVRIALGKKLTRLSQNDGIVTLEVEGPDGIEKHQARYVIGCDGAGSTTRKLAGLALDDLDFDEPWLVVDVLANDKGLAKLPKTSVQYCEPSRPTSLIMGTGAHRRWEFSLNPGEDPRKMEQPEAVWKLLSRWLSPEDGALWRSASYRFHALVARDWRNGRIFIAGDAAHQQPPFLGQGLCQGIRDVANLSWKLSACLRGGAGASLINSYGLERSAHVKALTGTIKHIGHLIGERDREKAAARDDRLIAEAGGIVRPVPRQDLMPRLAEGFLDDAPSPARGELFPQPWMITPQGKKRMDDILPPGFRLVSLNTVSSETEKAAAAAGCTTYQIASEEGHGLAECDDLLKRWFEKRSVSSALIRPDHCVYGTATDATGEQRLLKDIARKWPG